MLTDLQIRDYLQARLNAHAVALDAANGGKVFPPGRTDLDGLSLASVTPCAREERWTKHDEWAVYKNQNKTASRVLGSEEDAYRWICAEGNGGDTYRVVHRPGRETRCLDYCEVRPFCPFGARLAMD